MGGAVHGLEDCYDFFKVFHLSAEFAYSSLGPLCAYQPEFRRGYPCADCLVRNFHLPTYLCGGLFPYEVPFQGGLMDFLRVVF